MTRTRKTKRCPLVAHYAAPNGCCIGCGKSYQQNRPLTVRKAATILHEGKTKGRKLTARQRRFFGARASGYPPITNPAHRGYYIQQLRDGSFAISKDGFHISYAPTQAAAVGIVNMLAGTRPNPPTKPGVKRIGRAQKLFYLRDQGRVPGPYVHKYTRRAAGVWTYPPGWAFFPNRVAVIR